MQSSTTDTNHENHVHHWQWKFAPPVLLIIGIVFSVYGWQEEVGHTEERNEEYFTALVDDTQEALRTRLALYEQSLRGAVGFVTASDIVTREDWGIYVGKLDISQTLPGIVGIGYVDYVLEQDLPSYLEEIRQDNAANFTNYPETNFTDKFIVRYMAAGDNPNVEEVVGLDNGSEETRRRVSEISRDTGETRISNVIRRQAVNIANSNAPPSFLMLVPVYEGGTIPDSVGARRANIRGWVESPFMAEDLLQDLIEVSRDQVAFRVYDGTELSPENVIYSNRDESHSEPEFITQTTLEIAGQIWTIQWHSTEFFEPPSDPNTPIYLLCFELFIVLLLALLLQLLVRQNVLVSQRVRQRTSELNEAKKRAENADAMKSDFLANMSHELRTPLNGIIGTADLLMNTQLTERQYEYSNIIARSGESLLLLINDILDISKIEAGELEINPEPFVLRHMLKDALQPQLSKASQSDTELNVDYNPSVPYGIVGDPLRISQVVINLVGNAIKFADHGSVTVRIDYQNVSAGKVNLRVEVEDSGIGIAPDRIQEIFGKFSQADGKITRKYGGTGLGLAISKNLVELMGGEIGVESEPGQGSTFWFTLPVEVAQLEPPENQSQDMDTVKEKKVLVIEPSPITRKIIGKYLTEFGIEHYTTASAAEGQTVIEEKAYDSCVVSSALEEADIESIMRHAQNARPDLKFVLVTSVTAIPEMGAIKSSGFSSFILKPVYPDDLIEALMRTSGIESFRKQVRTRRHTKVADTKILLVEDDPINQQVAGRMLEELGYTHDVANNGLEAIKMAKTGEYGLALMDVMMPKMDGYTATQKLREMQEKNEVVHFPIIALTANAMKEQIDKCLAAGMDDFLTKPVRQRVLEDKLEQWLSNAEHEETLEPETSTAEDAGTHPETDDTDVPNLEMSQIEDLKEIMGESFGDFIKTSLENIARLVEELHKGVAEEDYQLIYQSSHSLISNCSYLGAADASKLAREIESLAHPSTDPGAEAKEAILPLLQNLAGEIESVTPYLQNMAKQA